MVKLFVKNVTENIYPHDKFPLKIANISHRKAQFPGNEIPTYFIFFSMHVCMWTTQFTSALIGHHVHYTEMHMKSTSKGFFNEIVKMLSFFYAIVKMLSVLMHMTFKSH